MQQWDCFLKDTDWRGALHREFAKPYWQKLTGFVDREQRAVPGAIFPEQSQIDAAFHLTSLATTRVVILGQDPYPTPGHAHGLCFSVPVGVDIPRSLANVFDELHSDYPSLQPPASGDLTRWAEQGVLLLNSTLTVRGGVPGSHRGQGWARFTTAVLSVVSQKEAPVVFVLWGSDARAKASRSRKVSVIDRKSNRVVESAHPSRPHQGFRGAKPFSKIDEALKQLESDPIDWQLEGGSPAGKRQPERPGSDVPGPSAMRRYDTLVAANRECSMLRPDGHSLKSVRARLRGV